MAFAPEPCPDIDPAGETLAGLTRLDIVDIDLHPDFRCLVELAKKTLRAPFVTIAIDSTALPGIGVLKGLSPILMRRDLELCSRTLVRATTGAAPLPLAIANTDTLFARAPRPRAYRRLAGEPPMKSFAAFPITSEDRVIPGVIAAIDSKVRTFDTAEMADLGRFAALAGSLLDKQMDTEKLDRVCRLQDTQTGIIAAQTKAIAVQKRILDAATKLARMGAWELDLTTGRYTWTENMYRLHEIELDFDITSPTSNIDSFYLPADRARVKRIIEQFRKSNQPFMFEAQMRTAKGNHRWIRMTGEVEFANGAPIRRFGMKQDITEEKLMLDRVTHLALRDELTGLYKRSAMIDRMLELAIRPQPERVSLLVIDLDGFKGVNDGFGHEAGDACLKRIARRLDRLALGRKLTSRLGGDEFAILIEGRHERGDFARIAARVHEAILKPIRSRLGTFGLGASIGIATRAAGMHIDHGPLLREADTAMYSAKQAGRNEAREYGEHMRNARLNRDRNKINPSARDSSIRSPFPELDRAMRKKQAEPA